MSFLVHIDLRKSRIACMGEERFLCIHRKYPVSAKQKKIMTFLLVQIQFLAGIGSSSKKVNVLNIKNKYELSSFKEIYSGIFCREEERRELWNIIYIS